MSLTPFCNICGKLRAETKTKRLVPDHNHMTKYIRGWLCDVCNTYMGVLESVKDIKARKSKGFLNWYDTYQRRIDLHLNTNTGILFRDRREKWYGCTT